MTHRKATLQEAIIKSRAVTYAICSMVFLSFQQIHAQNYVNFSQPVSVNLDGRAPHPSAILDLTGSGNGIRMSAIHSDSLFSNFNPLEIATGTMWYVTDKKCLYIKTNLVSNWATNCFHIGRTSGILPHIESEESDYLLSVSSKNKSSLITKEEISIEDGLEMHNVLFSVSDAVSYTLPSAGAPGTRIPYNNENIDVGTQFSNNRFIAPRMGYFYFTADVTFTGGDGSDDSIYLQFNKNDLPTAIRVLLSPRYFTRSGKEQTTSISGILLLEDGDTVDLRAQGVSSPVVKVSRRTFSGFLLSH